MNRRSILKRIGAVGAAALVAGTASASDGGRDEVTLVFPDDRDSVTISGNCICDDCLSCDCPPECDYCAC